ncbi:hypothetical protein AKJ39_00900 [candidate division MSBL1 archaeon SCGC-AAA259J03]|uniref:Argininosuccinate lyase n=1 Tax=candidate division MSBL1 archaeon SCGC-AAA259J03 TaxID=1698269 RepID=A0A656YXT1_9EURY|nr:hypothetical protein AKJ39_00900 [candidate division MSBL1 archaeon SCGC-AAA259J03]
MIMHREGRFEKSMDPDAAEYTASLKEDIKLFTAVVQVNIAHVQMLKQTDIVEKSDAEKILRALSELQEKDPEKLDLRPELEDIHMVIEEYVKNKIGEEAGGKLHTAKSRNDQVATAIRMVLREEILEIQTLIVEFIEEMIELAEENTTTIMPGYTHLQVAEPSTFAHYLGSYIQALIRDFDRLEEAFAITNRCPLGSCAFAGTGFPIDRNLTSNLLGFAEICENTMDATSSRDFALQTMSNLSILMTNLSRLAEELILWSSTEFDMISMPDEFSSTSSIMPQKKNPVVAELERAKCGRTAGNLVGGLNIMKNLPQAYNLDLQELTPLLWDSTEQTKSSLNVMKKMIGKVKPKPENMRKNAVKGFATLTELANILVLEAGIPFREAHKIVGQLSSLANEKGKSLENLTIKDLNSASEKVLSEKIDISESKFKEALDLDNCVESRKVLGGPSPQSMEKELSKFSERIKKLENDLKEKRDFISRSLKKLKKSN